MKVLHIASTNLDLTPQLKYGGTERVILALDKEFSKLGIESIVAATANSVVEGTLLPTLEHSAWLGPKKEENFSELCKYNLTRREEHSKKIFEYLLNNPVDIIHEHSRDFIMSEYFQKNYNLNIPILATFHSSEIDKKIIKKLREIAFKKNIYFSMISNSQKEEFLDILGNRIKKVIYHGINVEDFPFEKQKRRFLFSLGKIDSVKGQDIAIKVAKDLDMPLVIGGQIQTFIKERKDYWEKEIKPFVDAFYLDVPAEDVGSLIEDIKNKRVVYVGELDDKRKKEWYKYSQCFLMPIRWREAFGLVMIEAMACGTPVVAFNKGSPPEIIKHGETGFVVNTLEEMVDAVKHIEEINPIDCRRRVEKNFTIQQEAKNYLELYKEIIYN